MALTSCGFPLMHMEAPSSVEKMGCWTHFAGKEPSGVPRSGDALSLEARVGIGCNFRAGCGLHRVLFEVRVRFSREGSEQQQRGSSDPAAFSPGVLSTAQQAIDQSRRSTSEKPRTILRPRNAAAHKAGTKPGRDRGPIPVSDVLSLNGGGSIVRVTLPFSSLIAMGVPVRPDLSDSRVTADVWMDPLLERSWESGVVPAGANVD